MTTASSANEYWLALLASPTFAAMAGLAANENSPLMVCGSNPSLAPLHGMAAMYVLMSLFHLSPWLKLARKTLSH